MSLLTRARAIKGIDQQALGGLARYTSVTTQYPIDYRGSSLSPALGLQIMTAYQCVRFLANMYAAIPTILYRRRPDGGKERADDSPLYRTFAVAPNPDMDAFTWKNLVKSNIETWGNHYSDIVRLGNGDVELWPIEPSRIEVYWDSNGRKAYDYLSPSGTRKSLDPARVFHLKALTTDGLVGLPPITVMRRALGLYRKAEQFAESVFDNGARPAIVMEHPMTLSDPAVQRLGAQMDALRGAGNAGKSIILEEGSKVHEIGFPPEDAQFMEARLFQKRELAAGFGMTLGLLNDPDAEEDFDKEIRQLMTITMVPAFEAFEQAAQLQIIQDDRYFVEFLADAYMRGDPKARADAFAVQWEHGNLNNDEWRRAENMDPLPDGLGQVFYRPANWVPLGGQDEEPQAVGGDGSTATQFGQEGPQPVPDESVAQLIDQVTRAKSMGFPKPSDPPMSQFDCPSCGKMVNRLAAPGTVGYCKGCKTEVTMGSVAA